VAIAIRSADAATARARAHGEVAARANTGAPAEVSLVPRRPRLAVVGPRRRTAGTVATLSGIVFAVMVGALAFQTQVARNQLQLDRIDHDIRVAREQYDSLRRERAELRSPGRLMQAAMSLDMVAASQSTFMNLDPDVVAAVQRSGATGGAAATSDADKEFAAYASVKAEAGGAP